MKKLTTSTSPQTLRIVPRRYTTSVRMTLRDDSTNEIYEFDLGSKVWEQVASAWNGSAFQWESSSSVEIVGDYLEITTNFSLGESRFYDMTVYSGSDIIYKDKIFCTDQTVNQATDNYYSVNFVPTGTDSTFWNLNSLNWEQGVNWADIQYQTYDNVSANDYIIL